MRQEQNGGKTDFSDRSGLKRNKKENVERLRGRTDLRLSLAHQMVTKASPIFSEWSGPGPSAGAFCRLTLILKADERKNKRNRHWLVRIHSS